MSVAAWLVLSRFVHYLALSILFGGAFFPLHAFTDPSPDLGRLPWLRPLLLGAACLTFLSGVAWFGLARAEMPAAEFTVWLFRLPLAAALIPFLVARRVTGTRFYAVLFGSLILIASIALIGHAGGDDGPASTIHRILDVFHLVAAGAWVGALAVFAGWVTLAADLQRLEAALERFSGVGTACVATLALSGILSPGFLSTFRTAYGQVLLAKLAVFIVMLMLAAANRYWLTPRLARALEKVSASASALRVLGFSILTETFLAVAVLFLVGWLGILSPALR